MDGGLGDGGRLHHAHRYHNIRVYQRDVHTQVTTSGFQVRATPVAIPGSAERGLCCAFLASQDPTGRQVPDATNDANHPSPALDDPIDPIDPIDPPNSE